MPQTILITGGAGVIGANLADALAAEGRDVLVYDALLRPGVEASLAWLKDRPPADLRGHRGYVSDTRRATADLGLLPPLPWRQGLTRLANRLAETRGLQIAALA